MLPKLRKDEPTQGSKSTPKSSTNMFDVLSKDRQKQNPPPTTFND